MYFWDEINEKDEAILNLLSTNARMSFSDIGRVIGVSRTAVKKRVDALERSGKIKGYRTIISTDESLEKTFTLIFECEENSLETVKEQLITADEVVTTFVVGKRNIIAICNAENIDEIAEFGRKICTLTGCVKKLKVGSIQEVSKGTLLL